MIIRCELQNKLMLMFNFNIVGLEATAEAKG